MVLTDTRVGKDRDRTSSVSQTTATHPAMDIPSVAVYTLLVGLPMIGVMHAYQSQLGDEGYMVCWRSNIDVSQCFGDARLSCRMKYFTFHRHSSTVWVISMSGIPKLQLFPASTTYRRAFIFCCGALYMEGDLPRQHWNSALLLFFEW